jgi:hypothetical protein
MGLINSLHVRARHRAGLDQDSRGLYQYVVEEEIKAAPSGALAKQGPRVIDLNDAKDSAPKRRSVSIARVKHGTLPD